MSEFYFLCSYCSARIDADISDAKILDLGECPQCKRNSLAIHSPYHFGGKFNAPTFVKQLLKDVPIVALLDTNEIYEYDAATGAYRQDSDKPGAQFPTWGSVSKALCGRVPAQ